MPVVDGLRSGLSLADLPGGRKLRKPLDLRTTSIHVSKARPIALVKPSASPTGRPLVERLCRRYRGRFRWSLGGGLFHSSASAAIPRGHRMPRRRVTAQLPDGA
jgi:hypothetical protein